MLENNSSENRPDSIGSSSSSSSDGLSAEALQELFQQTSNFTVKNVMDDNKNTDLYAFDNVLEESDALQWQNAAELLGGEEGHGEGKLL